MRQIDKETLERITRLLSNLQSAVELYNRTVHHAADPDNGAMKKHPSRHAMVCNLITDLQGEVNAITADQDEYFDERTDRWHDSEAAEFYDEWRNDWVKVSDSLPDVPALTSTQPLELSLVTELPARPFSWKRK